MWVLRLYLRFEASKKSKPIISPKEFALPNGHSGHFEGLADVVSVRVSGNIWRGSGEVRVADCRRTRSSSSGEFSKD